MGPSHVRSASCFARMAASRIDLIWLTPKATGALLIICNISASRREDVIKSASQRHGLWNPFGTESNGWSVTSLRDNVNQSKAKTYESNARFLLRSDAFGWHPFANGATIRAKRQPPTFHRWGPEVGCGRTPSLAPRMTPSASCGAVLIEMWRPWMKRQVSYPVESLTGQSLAVRPKRKRMPDHERHNWGNGFTRLPQVHQVVCLLAILSLRSHIHLSD